MQEHEIELMKRYIYQVVRRMPKGQRNETSLELEELISDMYDAGKGTMEQILEELGDPKEVAKKHLNFKGYLIGPEYFDNYWWILKIVLLCSGISAFLSEIVSYDYKAFEFVEYCIDVTMNTAMGMVGAFGMVTLVFAILEYMQVKVDLKREKEWSPDKLQEETTGENVRATNTADSVKGKKRWTSEELSPIPNKKAMISRGETVISVVVIMIICSLLVFMPLAFGFYIFDGKEFVRSIPIFNMDKWSIICPLLLATLLMAFIDDTIRLVSGCYCKLVLISSVITNTIQLILLTVLFKFLPVWNPGYADEISKELDRKFISKGDIMAYWGTDTISNIVLAILWGIILAEMGFTIYKTIRYGDK